MWIGSYLAGLVVDDGVEEGEDCDLEVGRVLRLVQTAPQIHDQRLHAAERSENAHANKRCEQLLSSHSAHAHNKSTCART